jgi:hypothetical protein
MIHWLLSRHWRKSTSLSSSEIEVIKEILPAEDSRSEKLLSQAINAPGVERSLRGHDSYEVTIPYVLDAANLIDLDDDIQSPSIDVVLAPTQRKARFHVRLLRGGFLHSLVGHTLDGGPWPLEWTKYHHAIDDVVEVPIQNWLPRELSDQERSSILRNLEQWARVPVGQLTKYNQDDLRVYLPSAERDIAMLEQREQLSLPSEYRSMLGVTNGIDVIAGRPFVVGGTRDLRRVTESGNPCWIVTDLFEFGAVVMEPTTGALTLRRGSETESITSLRDYVVETIQMLDDRRL